MIKIRIYNGRTNIHQNNDDGTDNSETPDSTDGKLPISFADLTKSDDSPQNNRYQMNVHKIDAASLKIAEEIMTENNLLSGSPVGNGLQPNTPGQLTTRGRSLGIVRDPGDDRTQVEAV